jgi:hypothetical protein
MKPFNQSILKIFSVVSLLFIFSSSYAGALDMLTAPILPPAQLSIVGAGMGNAMMADGTQFNATAYNPALLGRAPSTLELLQLGIHISNDDITTANYVQNIANNGINFNATDFVQGILSNNSALVTPNLKTLDDINANIMNRSIEAGVGDNLAIKFTPNFGVQVYETANGIAEIKPGTLLQQLTNIPLPYTSGAGAAVTTALGSAIQAGVNSIVPVSDQTGAVQTDINNIKNGSLSVSAGVSQIGQDLANQGVTLNSGSLQTLQNTIINNLLKDIAYANALAYSDTVAMATVAFNPLEDFPLTVGISGKVVHRYFAWSSLTISTTNSSQQVTNFSDDLQQGTTRWGIDFGLLYAFEQDLSLGISFQDLIKQSATSSNTSTLGDIMYGVITDPAPTVTNLGLSWHPIHEFVVNADLDDVFSSTSLYYNQDIFSHFKLGSSVELAGIIRLRGGLDTGNFVGGVGLQLGFLGLDYSYGIDPVTEAYNHYGQLKLVF